MALIELTEEITNSIENKLSTIGIFIDLRKAFDTIDHRILLKKLEYIGVRGMVLKWVESYLSNRKQYVDFNNSLLKEVVCGVPQGSILGPKLFILYINDICNVSDILRFALFADDTNIFSSHNDITILFDRVNEELLRL